MSEHNWAQDNLNAYVTGGLSAQERGRVEKHVAGCTECAHEQADICETEQLMEGIFARVRPDAGLEDRVIHKLRQTRKPRPSWLRFVTAAAAVILLGVIGGGVQMFALDGTLSLPGMQADAGKQTETVNGKRSYFGLLAVNQPQSEGEAAVKKFKEELTDNADLLKSEKQQQEYYKVFTQEGLQGKKDKDTLLTLDLPAADKGDSKKAKAPVSLPDPSTQFYIDRDNDSTKGKRKIDEGRSFYEEGGASKGDKVGDKGGESTLLSKMKATTKNNDEEKLKESLQKALEKLPDFGDGKKKRGEDFAPLDPKAKGEGPGAGGFGKIPPGHGAGFAGGGMMGMGGGMAGFNPNQQGGMGGMFGMGAVPSPSLPSPKATPVQPGYYQPTAPPPVDVAKAEKPSPTTTKPGGEGKPGEAGGKGEPGDDKKPPQIELPPQEKPQPKIVVPENTGRKIIRTGEMEFETESFDKSVDAINGLINAVQGGFIATVNSDKLPNGKMRGSVVVRMPPQHLDKFLFDLRRELTKTGELKNQRIGSQDVTKAYSDIESRLRAARAIEERLINIIKTGKGEIKDLVAAERELGVWRTKIEEMEGEIRYYNNQVGLSTLTISLSEKEILTPTAIVVTETVTIRLEVDEVAKAHQTAMKAIEDLKGRITHSELKQHSAGQFQSVLRAELPPASKEIFVEQLKKLGLVSDFQENQRQHTEGGTGKAPALKPKSSDVHFDITMHNTANIRPRLSADLKIATTDVPAAYNKLLVAIAKAKGQVRDGKLSEKDKLNIHATLEFNVPSSEKQGIDKLLEDFGLTLERINVQAPISELSTERKFGYTLLLRDFASIPPRQGVVEVIAATDVPGAYQKLQDAISKAKGQISAANLDEKDKLHIHAHIEFTVPSEERKTFEKLLEEIGSLLSRDKFEAPINQLSTAKKFGFSLTLLDFVSVPPRQSVAQIVATIDVPLSLLKLQDAIGKAKGHLTESKLNEQDKFNITAQLAFTVPSEERKTIEKLLEDLGTVVSRNNVQTPANQLATAKKYGFSLLLRDFASIPPSKAADMKVATNDVPASYAKLLDAVTKAKGQLVDAKLNENDKYNITAQVDFNIPTEEKATMDKLLADMGAILSRNNMQMPMNQLSIAKKFGYSITLRDFANILPSHAAEIKVAATDVPNNYAKLVEAIVKAKGQIRTAKLNEQDKLNITAHLDFSVPTTEKAGIDKLLGEVGPMLSRNNVQAPLNELTTERKFGYSLVLRDFANIPPRETFHVQIAATDVPASFRELQDAVAAAKGLVTVGQLTEDSKVRIEAKFEFDVPAAERQAIEKLFAKVGAVLGRTSSQIPVNELATDMKFGYRLTLRSTAAIPPRETIAVRQEVSDVDSRSIELKDLIRAGKGRIIDSNVDRHENGQVSAVLKFEVPFASQDTLLKQVAGGRKFASQKATRNPTVPENELTTSHIIVTLSGVSPIVPNDEGLGSYVRTSLYMSFKVFSVCLMLIILGVSAVLPWVLVVWVAYKIYCRLTGPSSPDALQLATATGPTPPHTDAPQG